jgi:tetratricopeptide (TPR) repeat protein
MMDTANLPGENYRNCMAVSKPQSSSLYSDGKWTVPGICILLAVAVFVVFGQTIRHEFVDYDDDDYVYNNPPVINGLTLPDIKWAFTHSHSLNWHPLTWLSHMLDCQLYGLNAGGHHLSNVLFHTATTILLFLVLRRMAGLHSGNSAGERAAQAGATWPAAFVAAVFAIHPLRVESVAWVAERKDVLSGLFFMLTLWAYTRYVEKSKVQSPKSKVWYGLALVFFALGLMSKPMLVTIPFVLLLLDYWPLRRISDFGFRISDLKSASQRSTINHLLFEKLPFLLLSAASCVATVFAQKSVVATTQQLPFSVRLNHALVACTTYLGQMVWPHDLAVFYPYRYLPVEQIVGAGALLLCITALVFWGARRFPYLPVGWLWYLGMLVPVIGLVQVGHQSHADRYTYLPQIGLYLAITWAVRDLTVSWRHRRQILGMAALGIIGALMACSWQQTKYWRNSELLWTHTLACTSENDLAQSNLGQVLAAEGRLDEALDHSQKAIEINPDYALGHVNLAVALAGLGRTAEALEHFQKAIAIDPNQAEAHYDLGCIFDKQGKLDAAIEQYRKAIEIIPDYPEAHNNLGVVLMQSGRLDEAMDQYQTALRSKPDYPEAVNNAGQVLVAQGKLDEAIKQYRKALEIKPDYVEAHGNLAKVLAAQGRWDEAVKEYTAFTASDANTNNYLVQLQFADALMHAGRTREAVLHLNEVLRIKPDSIGIMNNLAWLLATSRETSVRDGARAVSLAEQACQLTHYRQTTLVGTLAAAYAEAGRFDDAISTAQKACALASESGQQELLKRNQELLELYRAHQPDREK